MTTRPYLKCNDANDVRDTADRLGSHFFSPDTMRFFKSRLLSFHRSLTDDSGLIITSEVYGDEPRHYNVRRYEITRGDDGQDWIDFDTISRHDTRGRAVTAAKNY